MRMTIGNKPFGALSYAAAIAAITNKTLYLRADTNTGTNGSNTNSFPQTNEGSVGGDVFSSSITINTSVQNGLRGFLLNAAAVGYTPAKTVANFFPSGRQFTAFLVEKRTGTQGTGSYNQSYVFGSDYFNIGFSTASSRQRTIYSYDTGLVFTNVGSPFTDGVAEVFAVRCDSSGNVRVNQNGTITTTSGVTVPSFRSISWDFGKANATGPNYVLEHIFSTDAIADATVDAIVAALRTKWGV